MLHRDMWHAYVCTSKCLIRAASFLLGQRVAVDLFLFYYNVVGFAFGLCGWSAMTIKRATKHRAGSLIIKSVK